MKLNQKEAKLLANFFDSETYRVYRKVFGEERQMELAQESVFAPDMEFVHVNKGRISEIRHQHKELEKIAKRVEAHEKS